MKITALAENTSEREDLKTVHGLSIYIETPMHKLLFDTGPEGIAFVNAEKLGVDLADVDAAIISHGHYDHGGALKKFLEVNGKAKVYIRELAFEPYFVNNAGEKKYIGLDKELAKSDRIVFTGDTMRIDDELFLFSDVALSLDTKSRTALLRQTADGYEQDDFKHEQNLILTAEGKAVLFSGCSHSGVGGILEEALRYRPDICAVFGGFHLFNPNSDETEEDDLVCRLAESLATCDTVFYTCHCTGKKAFEIMHEIMWERLRYFSTGMVVEL